MYPTLHLILNDHRVQVKGIQANTLEMGVIRKHKIKSVWYRQTNNKSRAMFISINLLTCSQKRVLLRKISLLQERNNLIYSYNDKKGEGIGVLRYKGLCENVAKNKEFLV